MRRALLLGGVIVAAALVLPAGAEPLTLYPTEQKTITSPEVEVRSGPSANSNFYSTLKLRRGDAVEVIRNAPAQDGWVAIKPPRGSFSWVPAQAVRQEGAHGGTILAEHTRVLVGSSLVDQPPKVRSVFLARGAQVVILDKPLVCSDGSRWFPIAPHPSEVRYIPTSAFDPAVPVQTVSAKVGGPPPGFGQGGESDAIAQNPTIREAEQAEARRDYARAEQLYRQASQSNDQTVRILCQNRLLALQKQTPPPGNVQLGSPTAPGNPADVNSQGTVMPATSLYGGAGQPVSGSSPAPDWTRQAGLLIRTGQTIDGKPLYAFTNLTGQCICHVIAQPGLDLERSLNQRLQLYGTKSYRGELRGDLLTASHLQLRQ